jgi:hypothetical protein
MSRVWLKSSLNSLSYLLNLIRCSLNSFINKHMHYLLSYLPFSFLLSYFRSRFSFPSRLILFKYFFPHCLSKTALRTDIRYDDFVR